MTLNETIAHIESLLYRKLTPDEILIFIVAYYAGENEGKKVASK